MHSYVLRLAFVLVLFLTCSCWADNPQQPEQTLRVDPSLTSSRELRLTGDLRFYRHIDPVTGQGAGSLHAGGKEIPLDLRQFTKDILLRSGPHMVKGHWSKEQRLVVTEAHPS
jgi:hypothetical protein